MCDGGGREGGLCWVGSVALLVYGADVGEEL